VSGTSRTRAAVGAAAAAAAFVLVYRPWHLRWGATDDEVRLPMPGDDLVPEATFAPTRAVTVAATPADIWPWLVQVGFGRAGFYSYDLLDNLGRRSARRIVPELQDLRVGTWVPMAPGTPTRETAFQVRAFEPDRWLLWDKTASTWCWMLRPIDEGRTRLVSRVRARYRWNRPTIATDLFLMEGGDFFMMRKMLLGIRDRAEATRRERRDGRPYPGPRPALNL
jgi:hypothetical protein